jgi:hypothetical protein
VSSIYRVLCLSHDPAIVVTDPGYNRPEQAEEAIRAGVDEHPHCDLLIGRFSYPLVEAGCPASRDRAGGHRCTHGGTVWADADVLRLLAAGYQSQDAGVREATRRFEGWCWSWERLRRLRDELGISVREEQPAAKAGCAHCGEPIVGPHIREWNGPAGNPTRRWHGDRPECEVAATRAEAPDGTRYDWHDGTDGATPHRAANEQPVSAPDTPPMKAPPPRDCLFARGGGRPCLASDRCANCDPKEQL